MAEAGSARFPEQKLRRIDRDGAAYGTFNDPPATWVSHMRNASSWAVAGSGLVAFLLSLFVRNQMSRPEYSFFDLDDAIIRENEAGNLAIWEGDGWRTFRGKASFRYAARQITATAALAGLEARYRALTGKTLPRGKAEALLHEERVSQKTAAQAAHAHA